MRHISFWRKLFSAGGNSVYDRWEGRISHSVLYHYRAFVGAVFKEKMSASYLVRCSPLPGGTVFPLHDRISDTAKVRCSRLYWCVYVCRADYGD